ncbi:hypothetical protein LTR65_000321 [Meristemomyces frigidus]
MDRGRIPGYYYDEEKKKYFKIQANHVAPADAKYSKSNVKFEERKAKKRKVEDRSRARRFKQTVRPSQISEHPISGGVGLGRELGLRGHAVNLKDRDAFFGNDAIVSSTEAVFILDIASATSTYRVPVEEESRDLTWLNNRTVAYGEGRRVALFDTRSSGKSTRFQRNLPITAITSPGQSGLHLLVADNRRIDLYDTRMEKTPLFGFRHSHQGPQLQLTTNCSAAGSGLVAALDINNDIQTYNIRTGKVVGMLQRPLVKGKSLMTKLRWTEVAGGAPALQACQDNGLVKWTFGGTEDDEATRSHHRLP